MQRWDVEPTEPARPESKMVEVRFGRFVRYEDFQLIMRQHQDDLEDAYNAGFSEGFHCEDNPADLSGADLREADLSGAELSGANLRRADLSRADLNGAKFSPGWKIVREEV